MSAYKQFLTSDVITTPLKVHKDFTFQGSSSLNTASVSRFLGNNIYQFDFDPKIDPYTGNYTIITPGTTASLNIDLGFFHNEAASVGSSSFVINNTIFIATSSNSLPLNSYNIIYIPTASISSVTVNRVSQHINASSSYYSGIYNITSSNPATTLLKLNTKTTGYINNYNYVISGSTTTYFTGGTNDIVTNQQYQRLIYDSVKQLYYSDYLTSSYGDPVNRPILIPGRDTEGDRYVGATGSQAYYNYLQTTLTYPRYFPTYTGSLIGVLSIPMTTFGEYIDPYSFKMSFDGYDFYDDGEGNLMSGSQMMGNVIYTHGIITLTGNKGLYDSMSAATTSPTTALGAIYGTAKYGTNYVYGIYTPPLNLNNLINGFSTTNNFTCSFSSSYTIFEKQYKCTIRENEYNLTLNPSTISGSYTTGTNAGVVYSFVTGSDFSPYITTVGLYDEQQNLLAIGKLAQPVPGSPTTDTTILINLDM
jgi:hypothetical protein